MRFTHRIDDSLELRLLAPNDADDFHRLVMENRAHLAPWFWWVPSYDGAPAEAAAFVEQAIRTLADGTAVTVAIVADGEWVGMMGVGSINARNGDGELWYWLAHAAEGRGVTTRAAAAVLDHVFEEMGLHRVHLRCDVRNARSRALAERLGFRREGTMQECVVVNDERRDQHLYAILAREWKVQRGVARPMGRRSRGLSAPHAAQP
jgi:ribosomal-protein-serine acetyltransferase